MNKAEKRPFDPITLAKVVITDYQGTYQRLAQCAQKSADLGVDLDSLHQFLRSERHVPWIDSKDAQLHCISQDELINLSQSIKEVRVSWLSIKIESTELIHQLNSLIKTIRIRLYGYIRNMFRLGQQKAQVHRTRNKNYDTTDDSISQLIIENQILNMKIANLQAYRNQNNFKLAEIETNMQDLMAEFRLDSQLWGNGDVKSRILKDRSQNIERKYSTISLIQGTPEDAKSQHGIRRADDTLLRDVNSNDVSEFEETESFEYKQLDTNFINVLLQKNAQDIRYEGAKQEGKYQDYGQLYFGQLLFYAGIWQDGNMQGLGVLNNPSPVAVIRDLDIGNRQDIYKYWKTYQGDFKNNQWHGHGVLWFTNNERIQGQFEEGFLDGPCIYWKHDGTTVNGVWREGSLEIIF